MRKFFALALAVAMVLSLASVSFAANVGIADTFKTVYDYSGDNNVMNYKDNLVEYGDTAYIQLVDSNNKGINDYDMVEKLKIKAEFEMGEDLVESISIVKKYIDPKLTVSIKDDGSVDAAPTGATTIRDSGAAVATAPATYNFTYFDASDAANSPKAGTETATGLDPVNDKILTVTTDATFADGYYYFVAFKTVEQRTTGDTDVVGTLELNRKDVKSTTADNEEVKDLEVDFAFNCWYDNNYLSEGVVGASGFQMNWDDIYVLKFDYDDETDIEFGYENEGTFSVDVSGQGKMVVDFNTDANEAICDANPGAKMMFVNFNGAKFNRVGQFEYEMENMVAAYEIVDDKLVEIAGLEIDSETATFYTRTLGNYVFADTELVNTAAAVEAPVVEAPVVTNPSTGA